MLDDIRRGVSARVNDFFLTQHCKIIWFHLQNFERICLVEILIFQLKTLSPHLNEFLLTCVDFCSLFLNDH